VDALIGGIGSICHLRLGGSVDDAVQCLFIAMQVRRELLGPVASTLWRFTSRWPGQHMLLPGLLD
jgi:hypothetical protein